jgi:hypothetical protein
MLGLIVGLLGPTAAAQADTNTSINWSGYAVHRPGVKFRRVSGEWREPLGTCHAGSDTTYSAFWVGLGGYRLNSHALEQIGTEFNCTPTGHAVLSAWYELVPNPSRTIRMTVNPGDLMRAKVKVSGARVTVSLSDLTTGRSFHRTITDRYADISSAEWIAEAPSECLSVAQCQVLPLADFGSVGFTRVFAQTTRYGRGGISSAHWNHTRIVLANTNGRRYVSGSSPSATATPGALGSGGSAFTITYAGASTTAVTPSARTMLESARSQPRSTPLQR